MRKRIVVKFLNETDGAFRYREVDSAGTYIHDDREGATIGDIYIRSMAMPGKRPETITVTIEY